MSFLTKLQEEGQKARASLKKTATVVTTVSGRKFNASTGSYSDEIGPGFVVDTAPDPGIHYVCEGLYIGSQDASHNYNGVSVEKKKKSKRQRQRQPVETISSDDNKDDNDNDKDFFPGIAEIGITHIVNLVSKDRPFENLGVTYLNVAMLDLPEQSLRCLDEPLSFIHDALTAKNAEKKMRNSNNGNKILVHCNAGVSRASTIVIAYLIKYKGVSFQEGLDLVRINRPSANPNVGFRTQLLEFEKDCRSSSAGG